MATRLPNETYATLAAKIQESRDHKTARIAPNTTATTQDYNGDAAIDVCLYGHLIATLYPDGDVWLSDAGYPTPTTARRLRALVPEGYCVYIQNGHTYVKRAGKPDSSAIRLDNGTVIYS